MRERPYIRKQRNPTERQVIPAVSEILTSAKNFYNRSDLAVKLRHCSQPTIFVSYTVKLACMEFHTQHVPTADDILVATFCKIGRSKSLDILEAYKCKCGKRSTNSLYYTSMK